MKTVTRLFKAVILVVIVISFVAIGTCYGQAIPSKYENIDYLITFGGNANSTYGDDDHSQTNFIAIPKNNTAPFYIRVYDPEISGTNDQLYGTFDTKTTFSIYGGIGAYSNKDSRGLSPVGGYRAGNLLTEKVFGNEIIYNEKYYSFGPFNPKDGESDQDLNAYIFKIIVEAKTGNDCNAYNYFISTSATENIPVEGANAFAYKICFRLSVTNQKTAHLYPFADKRVISVQQHNFDLDNDGLLRLTTVAKKEWGMATSGDGNWASSVTKITPEEQNTSLDFHFERKLKINNDLVFYTTNQYGEALPFFSVPLGGAPKFKYKVDVQPKIED